MQDIVIKEYNTVSAWALYHRLGLETSNFSKWCRRVLKGLEPINYKNRIDYSIPHSVAQQICLTTKTEASNILREEFISFYNVILERNRELELLKSKTILIDEPVKIYLPDLYLYIQSRIGRNDLYFKMREIGLLTLKNKPTSLAVKLGLFYLDNKGVVVTDEGVRQVKKLLAKVLLNPIISVDLIKEVILNIKEEILFEEESHIYIIKGKKNYISASSIPKRFTPHVDYNILLNASANKKGLKPLELKKQWDYNRDYACALGNLTHYTIESLLNNTPKKVTVESSLLKDTDYNRITEASQKVLKWLEIEKYNIIGTEVMLYNEIEKIVGTLDLLVEKEGKYYIIDWKTNQKDIFNDHYNSYLTSPFNNLKASTFNKYQIQLSTYKFLVESSLPLKIEGLMIVVPPLNGEEVKIYKCTDFSNLIFNKNQNI